MAQPPLLMESPCIAPKRKKWRPYAGCQTNNQRARRIRKCPTHSGHKAYFPTPPLRGKVYRPALSSLRQSPGGDSAPVHRQRVNIVRGITCWLGLT